MPLTVTVDSAPLLAVLDRLYATTSDLTPIMDAIGMEMESRISQRFEDEADPLGLPWADWKPSTKANYPKDGNKRKLDRFGDMLAGLSHQATADSAIIGFDREYAAYHEWGTKYMVRRGLLFADPDAGTLAPDDERALIDIIMQTLDAALD